MLSLSTINNLPTTTAEQECVKGGVYVLFARGSGEHFDDKHAKKLKELLITGNNIGQGAFSVLDLPSRWAELGNLDENGKVDKNDYPAAGGKNPFSSAYSWLVSPRYGPSVKRGRDELVAHLNERVQRCIHTGAREAIVLAGYSQGADVIGWALGSLNPEVQASIAYVALYGDPKFDAGDGAERRKGNKPWWVQGNAKGWRIAYTIGNRQTEACVPGERHSKLCMPRWLVKGNDKEITIAASGVLGARQPYAPSDKWRGRIGSWCDAGDLICNGMAMRLLSIGSHDSSYDDSKPKRSWITASVPFVTGSVAYTLKRLYPTGVAQ